MSENDKSETNSTNAHTDNKVGETDRFANNGSKTIVPEYMVEKGSVNEVIIDREVRVDKNKVIEKSTKNETKQDRSENISKYDPSLDLPIALRKGTRSCTNTSISNYVLYENISP